MLAIRAIAAVKPHTHKQRCTVAFVIVEVFKEVTQILGRIKFVADGRLICLSGVLIRISSRYGDDLLAASLCLGEQLFVVVKRDARKDHEQC